MNRTDRLYALVEELRAVSPRPRSARELAERFEVSVRTIERDVAALQEARVPIYAEFGRRGGYVLDKRMSLPPLNFTPEEAVAIAVALSHEELPFAEQARSALRKVMEAMPDGEGERARALAERVQLIREDDRPAGPIATVVDQAVLTGGVLRIGYADAKGVPTEREVEPGVFVGNRRGEWYLVGWCRLREAVRVFRLDRIVGAEATGERAPARPPATFAPETGLLRQPVLN
ncbi:YafY family transcriptional regulator [Herbidospora galbida]|uniref:YafY family transcriptional regulator n=1 Tax=Herbidospora galbida TaxID=2575442 RepID=A0A4U3LTD1_9ACTN|nr:YafY family protein [Herbidospora galbida]TKK79060.1 YafY family transcriptional regulator [Herbidospora galbida]